MSRLPEKIAVLLMIYYYLTVMCYFDYNCIVIDFGAVYLLLVASKTDITLQRVEISVVKLLQYRPILSLSHCYQLAVDIDLHPHLQLQLLPPLLS